MCCIGLGVMVYKYRLDQAFLVSQIYILTDVCVIELSVDENKVLRPSIIIMKLCISLTLPDFVTYILKLYYRQMYLYKCFMSLSVFPFIEHSFLGIWQCSVLKFIYWNYVSFIYIEVIILAFLMEASVSVTFLLLCKETMTKTRWKKEFNLVYSSRGLS